MSVEELLLIALLPMLTGAIGAYVASKFIMKKVKAEAPDIFLDFIEQITPELPKLLAKDELQRFVYSIGILIGNGAKQGIGLQKSGGKFSFEGLLGQFLPQIAQQVLPKLFGQQPQGEQQPQAGTW